MRSINKPKCDHSNTFSDGYREECQDCGLTTDVLQDKVSELETKIDRDWET